jgi:hypothetical protein
MDRYSGIRYKVHLAESIDRTTFPELFRHKEFLKIRSRPDGVRLIKYICFLYDKNTQLVHEFQTDLKERKAQAARDAGYRMQNNSWSKEIQDVMDIQDKEATAAIMTFLKMQRHNVWTEIIVCEQELFDYQSIRFAPVGKKRGKSKDAFDEKTIIESTVKKDALLAACDKRLAILENLYEQFFGDNKDLQSEFQEMITPEKAERILDEIKSPEEAPEPTTDVLSN